MLSAAMPSESNDTPIILTCTICSSKYRSKTALANHMTSKKHKKAAALREGKDTIASSAVTDYNDEPMEISEPVPIAVGCCLFCTIPNFDEIPQLLSHMQKEHGFVLPYADRITDLEGLLEYLGFKVGVGAICLACDGTEKSFGSVQAVRSHMVDKGHCRIRGFINSDDFELDSFYDCSDPETLRHPESINEYGEIVLSDGALIGTRDMCSAYNQKVRTNTEEKVLNRLAIRNGEAKDPRERMKGALISGTHAQIQKSRAGHMPVREQKVLNRLTSKREMNSGMKSNKLQKYFKEQVMF